jgi:sulfate transport system ATP-binding protein
VRPHDLDIALQPSEGSAEAMIERVVHLGFEVRVELLLDDGRQVSAQLSRDEAEPLELERGQIVYVKAARTKAFG